jgi:hypothetical protein
MHRLGIHVLIWNTVDLGRKLEEFRIYYNEHRVHQSNSPWTTYFLTAISFPATSHLHRCIAATEIQKFPS